MTRIQVQPVDDERPHAAVASVRYSVQNSSRHGGFITIATSIISIGTAEAIGQALKDVRPESGSISVCLCVSNGRIRAVPGRMTRITPALFGQKEQIGNWTWAGDPGDK